MRRQAPLLAALLVVAYLCMGLLSVGCVDASHHDAGGGPHGAATHPGPHSAHAFFCSWSCQVNTLADASGAVVATAPLVRVERTVVSEQIVFSVECPQLARSRAPPFVFFV